LFLFRPHGLVYKVDDPTGEGVASAQQTREGAKSVVCNHFSSIITPKTTKESPQSC